MMGCGRLRARCPPPLPYSTGTPDPPPLSAWDSPVHSGQATGRARAGDTRAQRMSKPFCALRASLDTEEEATEARDAPPSEISPSSTSAARRSHSSRRSEDPVLSRRDELNLIRTMV